MRIFYFIYINLYEKWFIVKISMKYFKLNFVIRLIIDIIVDYFSINYSGIDDFLQQM